MLVLFETAAGYAVFKVNINFLKFVAKTLYLIVITSF